MAPSDFSSIRAPLSHAVAGTQPRGAPRSHRRMCPRLEPVSLETTKADDIALVIEEAIVSGELPPGTVLRQEQLSEQFQVSRTPVREALRRLAALGLVSFVPNRGVRVRTISREELHEAFKIGRASCRERVAREG